MIFHDAMRAYAERERAEEVVAEEVKEKEGSSSPSGPEKNNHPDGHDGDDNKNQLVSPNSGNGADLKQYNWTQSLNEVTINVPLGQRVRGKDLDVVIKTNELKVGLKGQPAILAGRLHDSVKADEANWYVNTDGDVKHDGSIITIELDKQTGMCWWPCVVTGEPEIDVKAVEPENSKLSDLDGETRATVEKMMFDQRQKEMGRKTSDELQKEEMIKKFMQAHPEMDFSQAKMG